MNSVGSALDSQRRPIQWRRQRPPRLPLWRGLWTLTVGLLATFGRRCLRRGLRADRHRRDHGCAVDAQGGALPGATVTVRTVETGAVRTAVSDATGRYRVPGLAPRPYELRAELEGFGTVEVKAIELTIGQELTQNLTLGIESLQTVVTVRGEAPAIEATRAPTSRPP